MTRCYSGPWLCATQEVWQRRHPFLALRYAVSNCVGRIAAINHLRTQCSTLQCLCGSDQEEAAHVWSAEEASHLLCRYGSRELKRNASAPARPSRPVPAKQPGAALQGLKRLLQRKQHCVSEVCRVLFVADKSSNDLHVKGQDQGSQDPSDFSSIYEEPLNQSVLSSYWHSQCHTLITMRAKKYMSRAS